METINAIKKKLTKQDKKNPRNRFSFHRKWNKKDRDGYNVSTQTISWCGRECLSNKEKKKRVGYWWPWPRLEALNNFHSGRHALHMQIGFESMVVIAFQITFSAEIYLNDFF
jgi:hypothetical protein